MIRTPTFTLTDTQLDSLVEALDFCLFNAEGYLDYLRTDAMEEDDADPDDIIEAADLFESDMHEWEWLHETLKAMVVARPKLSIRTPYNPENN